jgi:hypothetical protein
MTTVEIYHLERLRALLDSPKGCGIRLEYLRIPMTEPEQWAFWSAMNYDVARKLAENELRRDEQMKVVQDTLSRILARMTAIEMDLHARPSSLPSSLQPIESLEMPTASFTPATLCWLHRLLTDDLQLPEAVRGRFRAVQVSVSPRSYHFIPRLHQKPFGYPTKLASTYPCTKAGSAPPASEADALSPLARCRQGCGEVREHKRRQ